MRYFCGSVYIFLYIDCHPNIHVEDSKKDMAFTKSKMLMAEFVVLTIIMAHFTVT